MRTANLLEINTDRPISTSPRKYLWVRRTSRRQYNQHMSRMRDTLCEINPMPVMAIFGSIVGIAFVLSVLVH